MPYYRKKKFFSKSIKSILDQSYKKFEIIIIYDDTNLDELNYLKIFKKKYKNIKILINRFNLGAGISRNRGIKIASGKYIAFCDCDDLWKKKKLENQIKFMEKNNLQFSFTSYDIIDEKGKFLKKRKIIKNLSFKKLLRHCYIGLSTVILSKKLITKSCSFPNLKTKEDFTLWLKLAKKKVRMEGLNQSLSIWRKSNNSLSSSNYQKIKDGYFVYRNELKYGVIKSFYYLLVLSVNSILK
tara:strand:+ start:384 stop:1103 length:720 start_codon:yes stop_codon:yes gene_type:complete